MTKAQTRTRASLGLIDFVLSGLASCLAAYSTGVGLGLPNVGYVFVAGIVVGTIVSLSLHALVDDSKWPMLSGLLYALGASLAVAITRPLNPALPDGGFPPELIVSGVLTWMLMIGSFLAWRDSTLLFQAVPSIALFGLVGSWDTFKASPVAFFAFLLCLATLFGRVHARAMLRQAQASGYTDTHQLPSTAWRWMAGPEWALASAAAVILVSLVGAPILQESVKGFTDAIKVRVPTPPAVRAQQNAARANTGRSQIGTGPVELGEEEIFRVAMDQPRYMRTQIYDVYDGRGWTNSYLGWQRGLVSDNTDLRDKALTTIEGGEEFEFKVELTSSIGFVPVPGEVVSVDVLPSMRALPDGTFTIGSGSTQNRNREIGGTAIEVRSLNNVRHAYNDIKHSWDSSTISPRVVQLARQVTANAKTDLEKARAIKAEIERRCTYNLNAEAVPRGRDPVEYFLFEGKEGYCDLFGSAMTLMARAVDLPARYSVGYYPVRNEMDNGKYVLRESEYHAWSDIFFEGAGWVPFDATEGAAFAPGSERGATSKGKLTRQVIIGSVALGGIVGGGWYLFALIKRRRLSRTAEDVTAQKLQEVHLLYARFAKVLEKKSGRPRKLSQTAYEYLNAIAPDLAHGEAEARRLNDRFVQTLYGRPNFDDGLLAELREQIGIVKKTLAKSKA